MTNFSKRFMLVGSLLRPKELLDYKNKIEHDDSIEYPFYDDLEGYKECEQKWVKDIVEKQIENGLVDISNGEFQRSTWHLDFAWGLKGIKSFIADKGYMFMDDDHKENNFKTRKDVGLELVGKLSGKTMNL